MKIAIYSRGIENNQLEDVQTLTQVLCSHGVEPVFYQDFFNQFYSAIQLPQQYATFNSAADMDESIDCLISLGGDGTLLDTVALAGPAEIPVLGVNYGRLGFLANTGKEELEAAMEDIVARKYHLDKRTLIHVDANVPLFGAAPFGLNEVSIHKKDTSPMIKIRTYLNGDFLNTYWADGLIISTATGSTGYNLSCGGPIIFPDSENFVITPVAPHNLSIRPVVINENTIVSFEVEGRTDGFLVTMDSRREVIPIEAQLAVKKEKFKLNLLRLPEHNFLNTLRNKLGWGLDKRN